MNTFVFVFITSFDQRTLQFASIFQIINSCKQAEKSRIQYKEHACRKNLGPQEQYTISLYTHTYRLENWKIFRSWQSFNF